MRTARRGVLILLLAFGGGCSGSDSGGGDWLPPRNGASIPIEAYSAAYVAALCEFSVRCGINDTQRGCELGTTLDIAPPIRVEAVRAGKILYDPLQAGRCVQLLKAAPCLQGYNIIDHPIIWNACQHAFTGTIPAGGMCIQSVECVTESCQVPGCPDNVCCVGVCADKDPPARNLPAGAACKDTSECAEETFCSPTFGCQPMVPAGEACDQAPCRWDTACLPSPTTGMRKCAEYVAIGQSCAGELCGAPGTPIAFCSLELICTASQYSDIGGPCDMERWCLHGVCRGGTCQPTAALNEACTAGGSEPCEQGIWSNRLITCENGLCTREPPIPDPCVSP